MIIVAFAFKRKLAPAHAAVINIVGASLLGTSQVADKAWPGDEFVDYVGLDMYDESWAKDTYTWPAAASAEEIAAVTGIGPKMASALREFLLKR